MHPSHQSPMELTGLHASRQGALSTHNPSRESRSSTLPSPYGIWGCGHGGTRNRNTSLRAYHSMVCASYRSTVVTPSILQVLRMSAVTPSPSQGPARDWHARHTLCLCRVHRVSSLARPRPPVLHSRIPCCPVSGDNGQSRAAGPGHRRCSTLGPLVTAVARAPGCVAGRWHRQSAGTPSMRSTP
jgi:hypothetical protein